MDAYLIFIPTAGPLPISDSPPSFGTVGALSKKIYPFTTVAVQPANVFRLADFSGSVEQTLNIGSPGTGAGAGKIVFDPVTISRVVDSYSPVLFGMAAMGTSFRFVDVIVVGKSPGDGSAVTYAAYRFGLAFLKTIGFQRGDVQPTEDIAIQFGSLVVAYNKLDAKGGFLWTARGWDRVKNVAITNPFA